MVGSEQLANMAAQNQTFENKNNEKLERMVYLLFYTN